MKTAKYVTYYRVSTKKQGQSGLGLEAQNLRQGFEHHFASAVLLVSPIARSGLLREVQIDCESEQKFRWKRQRNRSVGSQGRLLCKRAISIRRNVEVQTKG